MSSEWRRAYHNVRLVLLGRVKVAKFTRRGLVLLGILVCWCSLVRPPALLDNNSKRASHVGEQMTAYSWKSTLSKNQIPNHGDSVDPAELLQTYKERGPFGTYSVESMLPLDRVHRLGLIHLGAFIFLLDKKQRLLLAYRGPSMVTCPNSWSVLGEHADAGEELDPFKTVLRGLGEELGSRAVGHIQHQQNLMQDQKPIYYHRDYGPVLDNRIDRQLTYFWLVQLDSDGEDVLEEAHQGSDVLDKDEARRTKWLSIDEVEQWMVDEPKAFCHETILSFMRIGLARLKQVLADVPTTTDR